MESAGKIFSSYSFEADRLETGLLAVQQDHVSPWQLQRLSQEINQLTIGAVVDRRGGQPDLQSLFHDPDDLVAARPRLEVDLNAAEFALGGDLEYV